MCDPLLCSAHEYNIAKAEFLIFFLKENTQINHSMMNKDCFL